MTAATLTALTISTADILTIQAEAAAQNSEQPTYEELSEFNNWLDEQHPALRVAGISFDASRVLYTMDPELYYYTYQDFLRQQNDELRELVADEFPLPVALSYYRFEHGYDHNLQRLHLLRDTWEALINILHALVVSEFRFLGIEGHKAKIYFEDLFSDKLSQKLKNIECLLQYVDEQNFNLASSRVIPINTIKKMRALNSQRNEFSHGPALSEVDAQRFISDTEDDVYKLLRDLQALRYIGLLRYVGTEGAANNVKFESFKGHSLAYTITKQKLPMSIFASIAAFLNDEQILVRCEEQIWSLRPFIHFGQSETGLLSSLWFLRQRRKQQNPGDPPPALIFGPVARTDEFPLLESDFTSELTTLHQLFDRPAAARGGGKA